MKEGLRQSISSPKKTHTLILRNHLGAMWVVSEPCFYQQLQVVMYTTMWFLIDITINGLKRG